MIFHSFNYLLLFLPTLLALYYLNKKSFSKNLILIIASYLFYAWGNPLWGMLLFLASSVDFAVARKLGNLNLKLEFAPENLQKKILRQKKIFLVASLCFNFGLLAFFKYWNWIADAFFLTHHGITIFDLRQFKHSVAIPAGISFYTFETVSYTVDVYRKKLKPTSSFINYLSFISFFPHLVAGPILRAHDLLPQLENLGSKNLTRHGSRPALRGTPSSMGKIHAGITGKVAESAFFLISWGLFKKIVFADNFGNLVQRSKESLTIPGAGFVLAAAFFFQIYCDFSAYSDIARGTARLFGIRIKRNFLTPLFAVSPSELGHRWHITLSAWVRDYIYTPLARKNHGKIIKTLILLFTMALMGLWHGAGKFFVLWGIYYGLLMILYRILPIDRLLIKLLGNLWGKVASITAMLSFNLFSSILFFVKTDKEFLETFQSFRKISYLVTDFNLLPLRFFELFWGLLIFVTPIIVTESIGFAYKREFVDMQKFFGSKTKIALYVTMFYVALFFGVRESSDFIYFQF